MNVYDFDQTIYFPDSSYDFFRYCLKRFPSAVLPVLPAGIALALAYRRGRVGAKELKQQLFSFLSRLDDTDRIVADFWSSHRRKLQSWYLKQKRDDDLIISASPEFLLLPVARELGVRLIATRMDRATGQITGENCHDEEKVKRFFASYPDGKINSFYSDSLSDRPLAALAERAFLVKNGQLKPWPEP